MPDPLEQDQILLSEGPVVNEIVTLRSTRTEYVTPIHRPDQHPDACAFASYPKTMCTHAFLVIYDKRKMIDEKWFTETVVACPGFDRCSFISICPTDKQEMAKSA